MKDIFFSKNWNRMCLNNLEKEISFPYFDEPTRSYTEEGTPKKTLRKSIVRKDFQKSGLRDINVSLVKKPLELDDSKLIDGKD